MAAGSGNTHAVNLLLDCDAIIDATDDCGWTALHCAAQHGYTSVVETLLMAGADINKQQNEGATSVYLATYFDQMQVVEMLVSFGADLSIGDSTGLLPMDIAKQNQNANWYSLKVLEDATRDIDVTFV